MIRHGYCQLVAGNLPHTVLDDPDDFVCRDLYPPIPVVMMTLDDYERLVLLAEQASEAHLSLRESVHQLDQADMQDGLRLVLESDPDAPEEPEYEPDPVDFYIASETFYLPDRDQRFVCRVCLERYSRAELSASRGRCPRCMVPADQVPETVTSTKEEILW